MCQKSSTAAGTTVGSGGASQPLSKATSRTCVICESPLIGRSDKVFCDIKCKNKYHIEARKTQRTATSETNKILAKNYIILAGLLEQGTNVLISKLALARAGFDFDYVTEVRQENGNLVVGIYDLCWKQAAHNNIVVNVNRGRAPVSPFVFERWKRVHRPINEHVSLSGLDQLLSKLHFDHGLPIRNNYEYRP